MVVRVVRVKLYIFCRSARRKIDRTRVTNAASLMPKIQQGGGALATHAERVGRRALSQPCSWRSAAAARPSSPRGASQIDHRAAAPASPG